MTEDLRASSQPLEDEDIDRAFGQALADADLSDLITDARRAVLKEKSAARTLRRRILGLVAAAILVFPLFGAIQSLQRLWTLEDSETIESLENWHESLWPGMPDQIHGPRGMEEWLAQAREAKKALPALQKRVRELQQAADGDRETAYDERIEVITRKLEQLERNRIFYEENRHAQAGGPWVKVVQEQIHSLASEHRDLNTFGFRDPKTSREYSRLVQAAHKAERLISKIRSVEQRLEKAKRLHEETVIRYAGQWQDTIRKVHQSELYDGLILRPQVGLVPLGRDPQSQLFEFCHVLTGSIPERDQSTGQLLLKEDCGIVLVLIPAGDATIGSQTEDPFGVNPVKGLGSGSIDGPPRQASITTPFLLSKYEVTQAQWFRTMGTNPSRFLAGNLCWGNRLDGRHPVDSVSWHDAEKAARRLGMRLPTSLEWVYAARAGTTTMFPSGDELSAEGTGNFSDLTRRDTNIGLEAECAPWRDGWVCSARAGSFAPNPFGLHDMFGNLWEWTSTSRIPKGAEVTASEWQPRLYQRRGGAWDDPPRWCVPGHINWSWPERTYNGQGFRPAMDLR